MRKPLDPSTLEHWLVDIAIGRRLRAARIKAGLNQTEFGKAMGLTFQQIQKYEHGVNRISASRLLWIARFLDIPVISLLEDPEPPAAGPAQMAEPPKRPAAKPLFRARSHLHEGWHRRLVLTVIRGLGSWRRWHPETIG